ncbi:tripartite tricarboxylate transporter substrate binding protein [Alcaligenaceae bacterium]|nr:tripartite tricarboxylate transporter substrate binding protein [Alcaligenaceae bacterium]
MKLKRRALLTSLALATGLACLPASASEYPTKSIRMIVPFAPGGVTDMVSRTLADGMSKQLGQTIVVENRAGASGIPGSLATKNSAADGYTIMMGNISTLAINTAMFADLPYDPAKDFTPISMVSAQPLLVTVNASLPIHSVKDLIEHLQAKPDSLNFGSAGASLQLATEAFNQEAKITMTHVPYKGSGPAMTDLVAGHIQVLFDAFSSLQPFVQDGRVRALAITSRTRSPLMPDLPTLDELGLPNSEVNSWQGVVAPAGTPPEAIQRLNEAIREALKDPKMQEAFAKQGITATASTPEELGEFARKEAERWQSVAKLAGVQPS